MAVGAGEDLVVVAHAEFPPGQGAPGGVALPGGEAAGVDPTADGFIAWGVVYLEHRLGPAAVDRFFWKFPPLPGVVADIGVDHAILVAPVLPPVFHHHWLGDRAVWLAKAHDHDVLQADEVGAVCHHIDMLGAPGLVGAGGAEVRGVTHCLEEVEAGAVGTGHGQDGPAVALALVQAGFLQGQPGRAGCVRQGQLCAPGGAAAGAHGVILCKGPGVGELLRGPPGVAGAVGRRHSQRGGQQRAAQQEGGGTVCQSGDTAMCQRSGWC